MNLEQINELTAQDMAAVNQTILDQLMPEMEGAEVLAKLREQKVGVPVIVLTADTQGTTRQALIAAGATEVLSKPPQGERLINTLQKIL